MKDNDNIKIAKLEKRLTETIDHLERAVIVSEIENIKKKQKEEQIKKNKVSIHSVSDAPSVMDRQKPMPYKPHDASKLNVNGVYESKIGTSVII